MALENLTLLVNGRQAFPEIIRCIEEAQTSLEINMFIWRDDRIGNRMAQAVLAAADRGVTVYISVDRYGVVLEKCEECKRSFFHKEQTLTEKMKSRLLEVFYPENTQPGAVKDEHTDLYQRIMAHPNIRVSADVFKADHSKFYIIDDRILFLGGVNIEDKENGQDLSGRVYGDYMARLEGEEYVRAFREKLATGRDTLEDVFFGLNRKEPVRRFEMEELYLDLINGAQQELHITMAYFSPLEHFVEAILAAHRRGVKVTVLIPQRANFQNDSNRRTICQLLKGSNGGIRVWLSPKMLHTKLVMNEKTISFGSTNITKKAFNQLDELNLFVPNDDSEFAKAMLESIASDIRISQPVTDPDEVEHNRLMAWLEGFMV